MFWVLLLRIHASDCIFDLADKVAFDSVRLEFPMNASSMARSLLVNWDHWVVQVCTLAKAGLEVGDRLRREWMYYEDLLAELREGTDSLPFDLVGKLMLHIATRPTGRVWGRNSAARNSHPCRCTTSTCCFDVRHDGTLYCIF